MSEGAHGSSGGNSNTLVYFFGALGCMLFGYGTGVISGAILFIEADLGLNAFYQGLVVSSLLLGAMAGAGTAGPLSDRLGRRRIIIIAAIVFTLGALGAALAPNVAVLVLFRIVLGVAVGAAALIVPLYLSEVALRRWAALFSSADMLLLSGQPQLAQPTSGVRGIAFPVRRIFAVA